jgi:hypothetical protein
MIENEYEDEIDSIDINDYILDPSRDEKSVATELEWIPKVIQNYKLMNIGAMFVMKAMKSSIKGSSGLMGGNMSELLGMMMLIHKGYEMVR